MAVYDYVESEEDLAFSLGHYGVVVLHSLDFTFKSNKQEIPILAEKHQLTLFCEKWVAHLVKVTNCFFVVGRDENLLTAFGRSRLQHLSAVTNDVTLCSPLFFFSLFSLYHYHH